MKFIFYYIVMFLYKLFGRKHTSMPDCVGTQFVFTGKRYPIGWFRKIDGKVLAKTPDRETWHASVKEAIAWLKTQGNG